MRKEGVANPKMKVTRDIPTHLKLKQTEFRNPAKGVRKFKPMRKVTNRILYGLMLVEGITTMDLAEATNRSQRAVQTWINHGCLPNEDIQDKVAKILNVPYSIVWFEANQ